MTVTRSTILADHDLIEEMVRRRGLAATVRLVAQGLVSPTIYARHAAGILRKHL